MNAHQETKNNWFDHWLLRDIYSHRPNCERISNDILKSAIFTKWENEGTSLRIPYSFGLPSLLSEAFTIFSQYDEWKPTPFTNEDTILRNAIRLMLGAWSSASKGRIEFEEVTNLAPDQRGIVFNLADMADENLLGVTVPRLDNSGRLKKMLVFFANLKQQWNPDSDFWRDYAKHHGKDAAARAFANIFNTIAHEIGHALGLDHLHDNEKFCQLIKKMPDGAFCSVMPYYFYIQNSVNQCQNHCAPNHAVMPGVLDERMIELAYADNSVTPENDKLEVNYHLNALNTLIYSSVITGTHHYLTSFLTDLSFQPEKKLLKPIVAQLTSDATILVAGRYLNFSNTTSAIFILNTLCKYLLENFFGPHTDVVNYLILADTLVNFYLAYQEGNSLLPLLETTLTAFVGSSIGMFAGKGLGKITASCVNALPQTIYKKYHNQEEDDVSNNNNGTSTFSRVKSYLLKGYHTFFSHQNDNTSLLPTENPSLSPSLRKNI